MPWDHIDAGVTKDFLLRERQAGLLGKATPDCRNGECSYCGLCDFETIRPRLSDSSRLAPPAVVAEVELPEPALLPKVRLTVTKTGRTASLSHLEYMTLIHRAVRRAGLPIKYSAGFHPAPRISFGDALPLGVISEAELIDLELTVPCQPQEAMDRLNLELPEGVRVLKAESWPRNGEAPANSILAATFKVPLPEDSDDGLEDRLTKFLAQGTVITTRTKQNRATELDLRPWVLDLYLEGGFLWMRMASGSPLFLAAYLLQKDAEWVRALGIHKTSVELNDAASHTD